MDEGKVSAALRHVRDAERLLADSPDQSWHLAGFGPECIRKACLAGDWVHKALGHDWGPASENLLDWVVALSPEAQRYDLSGWGDLSAELAEWKPDDRYDKTGSHGAKAGLLTTFARGQVDRVVLALWADGRLEDPEV